MARFMNASCNPNCYTKIISIDGVKRICVYAKRDIRAGEELCYDYKFPIEYNEDERVPCKCGFDGCRGFLNWVSGIRALANRFDMMEYLTHFLQFAENLGQTLCCIASRKEGGRGHYCDCWDKERRIQTSLAKTA